MVLTVANAADQQRWERSAQYRHHTSGESLLESLGKPRTMQDVISTVPQFDDQEDIPGDDTAEPDVTGDELVPCTFLSVAGEAEVKVLARNSRVIVEDGDRIRERSPVALQPDDRILLGRGASRWSPAEEFTEAVVNAMQTTHPELIQMAGEWRRALREYRDKQRLSTAQVGRALATLGVVRKEQTIDGWLDLARAAPIAPRGLQTELTKLWPLIELLAEHPLEEAIAACSRLRSLRSAASGALLRLWKGTRVNLGVDESWLGDLVNQLRRTVRAYEVASVSLGNVPRAVVGWWIDPALAHRFETDDSRQPLELENDQEDESE